MNEALPFCPSPPFRGGGGAKWQSFVLGNEFAFQQLDEVRGECPLRRQELVGLEFARDASEQKTLQSQSAHLKGTIRNMGGKGPAKKCT